MRAASCAGPDAAIPAEPLRANAEAVFDRGGDKQLHLDLCFEPRGRAAEPCECLQAGLEEETPAGPSAALRVNWRCPDYSSLLRIRAGACAATPAGAQRVQAAGSQVSQADVCLPPSAPFHGVGPCKG